MTKNERVEVLKKELSEIDSLLNAIKECQDAPKSLISLAAEKAYYFGRNILLLSEEFDDHIAVRKFSEEGEKNGSNDYFLESEVENIILEPERCVSTRVSTNPNDMTPWMPDSQIFDDNKSKVKEDSSTEEILEVDTSSPEYTEQHKPVAEGTKTAINGNFSNETKMPKPIYDNISISKHLESSAPLGDQALQQQVKDEEEKKETVKIKKDNSSAEEVKSSEKSQPDNIVSGNKKEETKKTAEDNKAASKNNAKEENHNQKQAFESLFKKHPETAKVTSAPKTDIRRLLTLNDRFLFQRELFRGDVGLMNFTFDEINKLTTFEEAVKYIESNFKWDMELPEVKDFLNITERHFTGKTY